MTSFLGPLYRYIYGYVRAILTESTDSMIRVHISHLQGGNACSHL